MLASLLGVFAALPALAQGGLDSARQLYNLGRYDEAIAAAAPLRTAPTVDGANLVLGRAYLERFRKSRDQADLAAARDGLRDVRPARLTSSDRTEYLVGLGELLYLEESFGPAVEQFRIALDHGLDLAPRDLERLFDWWATALDRQAQSGAADDFIAVYESIRDRAQKELGRMPFSTAATYWLATSYRYLGDVTNAWNTAVAGWIRVQLGEEQGRALRADLDQLVLQAIIPERARQMVPADADREPAAVAADRELAAAGLRAAWDIVKKDWPNRQ